MKVWFGDKNPLWDMVPDVTPRPDKGFTTERVRVIVLVRMNVVVTRCSLLLVVCASFGIDDGVSVPNSDVAVAMRPVSVRFVTAVERTSVVANTLVLTAAVAVDAVKSSRELNRMTPWPKILPMTISKL